ncbi:MAG: acylneuraminate cytidylyltransferase family protein [Betaproteobacteria bacterium]|nr:acylneuraminate cytidylyltransferase family protein [Betaproteobacteria bacterium]
MSDAANTTPRVTALVPMRATSVRVPHKNIRTVAGRPLFTYVIDTLLAAETIATVAVDTDSDAIKAALRDHYPDVIIIDRLPELAGSDVSMNDVIAYDLSQLPGKLFLQTHSTNPLLRPQTVDCSVRTFLGQQAHDSLFSVHAVRKRFYDAAGQAVNHDPAVLLNTQDLPPLFEENSCIYLFSRSSFADTGARLGRAPMMFEMDARESVDIDDELDLEIVAALLQLGGR